MPEFYAPPTVPEPGPDELRESQIGHTLFLDSHDQPGPGSSAGCEGIAIVHSTSLSDLSRAWHERRDAAAVWDDGAAALASDETIEQVLITDLIAGS